MTDDNSPLHDGAEGQPGEGTQVAKVKKPWYRKWWVWVIVVVVIAAALSPSDDDGDETAQGEVTSAPSATEEPTPEPEEPSEPEDLVTIPDVSGMSADEARDQLEELGLEVGLDGGEHSVWNASNWEVESADPALGSEVKEGTEVTLNVTKSGSDASTDDDTSPVPVADAEALWLSMHGISSPTEFVSQGGYATDPGNPLYAIQTGWGGSTDGYLKIDVQEVLDDDSTKRLGINILNFIGPDFPDIGGIIFTDANGTNHNFFREDAPLADQ